MRRIGIIVGYMSAIIVFGGLLAGGIRFAQQQLASNVQPPAVVGQNPSQTKDTPESTSQESDPFTSSQQPSSAVPASELPQTGIEDNFLSVLGLGMITASVVAYIQSRRLVVTL